MNNCFLITSEYPYSQGEPFLENEICYLAKNFHHVYVFSINGSSDGATKRVTPENVIAYPLNGLTSRKKYLVYCVKGLFNKEPDLRLTSLNPLQSMSQLYLRGRAKDIKDAVFSIIERDHLEVENSLFYGFWFVHHAIVAWMLKKEFRNRGVKCSAICRAHGYDLYWERSLANYIPFQDVSLNNLEAVFVCSDNGKLYLDNKYPGNNNKVLVGRLGTEDHGLGSYSETKKVIVTCSNLERLKRVSLFADSFIEIIRKGYRNCYWVCIGDGEEYSTIQSKIKEKGVEEYVSMVGRIPNVEVLKLYGTSDVSFFCNVSTSEGVPVSIMEALSFGIPIIATDVGGVGELVGSDNGRLVSPDINEKILSEILEEMISLNSVDYMKMRENARKTWERKASARNNYLTFVNSLNSL